MINGAVAPFKQFQMKTAPILFYVDDDADDLMIFEIAAEAVGATASLFADGDLLLHSLNHPPPIPSVVFVDLNMPRISGYDIIREMKASDRLKDIPIVILSTASDALNIRKSRNMGANYYITKPTSLENLKRAIAHTLKIDWATFAPSDATFVHRD